MNDVFVLLEQIGLMVYCEVWTLLDNTAQALSSISKAASAPDVPTRGPSATALDQLLPC